MFPVIEGIMVYSSYLDKPRPAAGILLTMSAFLVFFLVLVPLSFTWEILPLFQVSIILILLLMILILLYGFWMLHHTSYLVDQEGIQVRYGSSEENYSWSEFSEVKRQRGLFALKLGWRGITPCVRLTDAVRLSRSHSKIPLFLTPTDPDQFLEVIRKLEPRLIY